MKFFRRRLLFSASSIIISSVFCLACKPVVKTKKRERGELMLTNPTAAELKILSSTKPHQVESVGEITLKISNRTFSGEVQLNEFIWNDIEFENCDFINCSMTRGTIRNARFINCLFFANLWQDRNWENVSFRDCAWHGPFKMGARKGGELIQFEECEFIGATAEELGYGGRVEYFGSIGGTNGKALYRQCKFERTFVHGGLSTEFLKSEMSDVVFYGQDNSRVVLENVIGSGVVELGNNIFTTVKFKESIFSDRLTLEGATIGAAVFEEVNANLDLSMVKAESIVLAHVTFNGSEEPKPQLQYGLNCESSKIKRLTIENCSFSRLGAELHLSGEETSEELTVGPLATSKNVYSTDIENLVIRSTPIINGHFKYMRITELTMENLRITSADFSRSIIGLFTANNVVLAENLELGDVIVKKNASSIRFHSSS